MKFNDAFPGQREDLSKLPDWLEDELAATEDHYIHGLRGESWLVRFGRQLARAEEIRREAQQEYQEPSRSRYEEFCPACGSEFYMDGKCLRCPSGQRWYADAQNREGAC